MISEYIVAAQITPLPQTQGQGARAPETEGRLPWWRTEPAAVREGSTGLLMAHNNNNNTHGELGTSRRPRPFAQPPA